VTIIDFLHIHADGLGFLIAFVATIRSLQAVFVTAINSG
jgi:hypothetical protein